MANSLSTVEQIEFDALVKLMYQSKGFILRDAIRMRSGVVGSQVQFRKVGEVIANPVGFGAYIQPQDPGFSPYVANLQKYAAATSTDIVQDLTVNFDVKLELAMTEAAAIGRRSDQIIINALNASGTPYAIPVNQGGGANTNMTYAKLRQVVAYFEENAVPLNERYLAMTGNNLAALLADDHFTSRFYTSNDAMVDGSLTNKEVLGVQVKIIPNMPEGGLPETGAIRTCFAWHKMALGMGIGMDMRTEINYAFKETSWYINSLFYAGAVAIDNLGIITIACDESVNP